MANKYEELIPKLVKEIGGVDNVKAATHCVSRLRLVLENDKKIKLDTIEKLPYVKGSFKVNGQLHIIFGQEVEEIFKDFIKYPGMASKQATASSIKNIGTQKQSLFKRSMNHLSEIFMPLIPILVAGGLILAIRNILETKWDGSWAIVNIPFFAGLNDFLWIPACAVFWFLPVFIVWSIFKKMNGSQALGILLGLSLLVSLPSLYELNDAINGSKPEDPTNQKIDWSIIADFFTKGLDGFKFAGWGSYPIKVGYTSQVIPAIGVAFLGVYTERFLTKYVTPVLKQIVVPLGTILFTYTIAMLAIGPAGFVIGTSISIIISSALTNEIAKYFVSPIFGLLYGPLVITGLHHTLNAVMVQNTATLGGSLIFPILAISNISQGAACLAYGILNRKDKKIKDVAYPACTSAWLGVTEPAMYGVNLKAMFPFFAAMIGSATGSLMVTMAGVTSNGIGNGAWLGVLNMQAISPVAGVNTWIGTGYAWFMISAILSTTVSMTLTYVFGKTNINNLIPTYKIKQFYVKLSHSLKTKKSKEKNQSKYNEKIKELEQEKNNFIQNKNCKNNCAKELKVNKNKVGQIFSIGNGHVYDISTVNDEAFKNKVLGDGLAIDCLDGNVYSPIKGKIEVVAPTKHAYGISGENGEEILIHIGIDTVNITEENCFIPHVNQGDKVELGQLLCKFDRDLVLEKGLDPKVMVIVTNESKLKIKNKTKNNEISINSEIMELE